MHETGIKACVSAVAMAGKDNQPIELRIEGGVKIYDLIAKIIE